MKEYTPRPITDEIIRFEKKFYHDIAREYRTLEYQSLVLAENMVNTDGMLMSEDNIHVFDWSSYRDVLLLSDMKNQMKNMKDTLGFTIGNSDGTRVIGSIESYKPLEHTQMDGKYTFDLIEGEPVLVRHSQISATIYGEEHILLPAVYERPLIL